MGNSDSTAARVFRKLTGLRRPAHGPGEPPARRAADREPLHGWTLAVALALGVAVVDWLVKYSIRTSMAIGDFRVVVEDRIALWHVQNDAMMLGLWESVSLDGRRMIAATAAVLATFVLLQIVGRAHRLPRQERVWAWVFVGLVLGGMLGNLGERLIHWGVTDYLSLRWGPYWMPPGNVADLALFLAIPLAMPVAFFELRARSRRRSDDTRSRACMGAGPEPSGTG
jgi:lipoprotein signal peptidase